MNYVIAIFQLLFLIAALVLLWQLWRKFKQIPEDEVIGEERAKYMTKRLNILAVCFAAEAVLSIVQLVLRSF